jgi:hypothetical protein
MSARIRAESVCRKSTTRNEALSLHGPNRGKRVQIRDGRQEGGRSCGAGPSWRGGSPIGFDARSPLFRGGCYFVTSASSTVA